MFGTQKKEEIDSLAHTRWNCKYHIALHQNIGEKQYMDKFGQISGAFLRKLCEYKGVEIIEAELAQTISICW